LTGHCRTDNLSTMLKEAKSMDLSCRVWRSGRPLVEELGRILAEGESLEGGAASGDTDGMEG